MSSLIRNICLPNCYRNFKLLCNLQSSLGKYLSSNSSRGSSETTSQDSTLRRFPEINDIPLTDPLPGLSASVFHNNALNSSIQPFDTKLTVLENGLKIASEAHFGQYCTLGVAINSGSRFAVQYPIGLPHFIEKLAFSQTSSFSTKKEIFDVLEKRCGLIDCQSTRDTFIFASSCHIDGVEDVLKIIADAVMRPIITADNLEEVRKIITFENNDMSAKPDCEPLLNDWIHMVSYTGNTLGHSKYCPINNLNLINENMIYGYLKHYHTPERIVIAGIGVDHDLLVSLSSQLFDTSKAIWTENWQLLPSSIPPMDASVAQYTGGEKQVLKDLSNIAPGPSPFPNLAHVVLGFESCGYRDDDFVSFCVLQALMGGGGSFSAGGPGKGMYTRLYVDVLNRCPWMYNATAFNIAYSDSGIFYIHASSDPAQLQETACVIADQFLLLYKGVGKEELERAKTQLKSQLMMNLEIRPVMFEDLARQVLGHGFRRKPLDYIHQIDCVTKADLRRVSERMLASSPSVVGYGDLTKLPDYQRFVTAFAKQALSELKKRSIFSF